MYEYICDEGNTVKAAIALSAVVLLILVGMLRTQSNNIRELQGEVRELGTKLDEKTRVDALEAKCVDQARKVFDESAYPKNEFAAYENHYSAKLDKCVMRVLHTDAHTSRGRMVSTYVDVMDAFQGKQYGTYVWHTETNKKFLIVPPVTCEVTLPTGEQKICHSMDEFEELVNVYLDDNYPQGNPRAATYSQVTLGK